MNIIGLIAEYNPFHNGHQYQINKIKEKYPDSILIAVISSSYTQRGDISVLNKWEKASIALDNQVDIVVELPFVYATQSSDIFARGAIEILNKLKVNKIIFGTERDTLEELILLADTQIKSKEYNKLVKKYQNEGLNYATSTNKALEDLTNIKVSTPNDLLALSYIREIKQKNYNIEYENIKRTIPYHSGQIEENIASASAIRKQYQEGKKISNLIPYSPNKLYKISMSMYYPILKYKILSEDKNLKKYQTVEEGIENRIIKYISESNTYEELINNIKTKRYTYNRISRMLLHILTNFTKEEAKNIKVDYIRLLGFNERGKNYLNKIKKTLDLPIVIGYKKNISKILDIELRITKIYSLVASPSLVKEEYRNKPIIK